MIFTLQDLLTAALSWDIPEFRLFALNRIHLSHHQDRHVPAVLRCLDIGHQSGACQSRVMELFQKVGGLWIWQ